MKKIKVLSVNMWPFASKSAIGYMTEHLFNNESLFHVMEIYTADVEVYHNLSERHLCNFNSLVIREKEKTNRTANTIPPKKKGRLSVAKKCVKAFLPVKFSKQMWAAIRDFSPDVIYTQGYDIRILKISRTLAKRLDRPLLVHTLDDWFTSDDPISDFLSRSELNRCLKKGESLAASPSMVERIDALFGKESLFITNCVPFKKWPVEYPEDRATDVLYAGNLTPNRYRSLNSVARALHERGAEMGICIHVYSPKDQIEAYGPEMEKNLILHEAVTQEKVKDLISASRVVLHVEPFDKEYRAFIQYSLSTKIAEYASQGKPIVYYGPDTVGSARFLSAEEIGSVYTEPVAAADWILELLSDREKYMEAAKLVLENGQSFFDKEIVQNKLYRAMAPGKQELQ